MRVPLGSFTHIRYSYDTCDIGILPNQTWVNGSGPDAALTSGSNDGPISYLPGMKASPCTCDGEDHPGPNNKVGRAAPEIDLIEAQIELDKFHGEVSQSLQTAPFDAEYRWDNTTEGTYTQYDKSITYFNTYLGGTYQQALSSLTAIDNDTYYNQEELTGETGRQYKMFAMEYLANPDDREKGYVKWWSQGKESWIVHGTALAPNSKTEVDQRLIPEEPMAIVSKEEDLRAQAPLLTPGLQLGHVEQLRERRLQQHDFPQLLAHRLRPRVSK